MEIVKNRVKTRKQTMRENLITYLSTENDESFPTENK